MALRFRELISAPTPSKEAFLREHPHPALIVERIDAAAAEEGDDSTDLLRPFTMVPSDPEVGQGKGDFSWRTVSPDARVEWLIKSDRNPFADFVTLGRARNNDVIVKSSSVSKIHLYFTHDEGRYYVEDRGSTNGSFLHGTRLPPGQRHALRSGDDLQIGKKIRAWYFEPEPFWELCARAHMEHPGLA